MDRLSRALRSTADECATLTPTLFSLSQAGEKASRRPQGWLVVNLNLGVFGTTLYR